MFFEESKKHNRTRSFAQPDNNVQNKFKPSPKQSLNSISNQSSAQSIKIEGLQIPYSQSPLDINCHRIGQCNQIEIPSSQAFNRSIQANQITSSTSQMFGKSQAQSVLVLQEQPVNIKPIGKQPLSSKNSSQQKIKPLSINYQSIQSTEQTLQNPNDKRSYIQQQQSSLSKLKQQQISCHEDKEPQRIMNHQEYNNSNHNNNDIGFSSGKVNKKHQRYKSEAIIPKKLVMIGQGGVSSIDPPFNKENQGFCFDGSGIKYTKGAPGERYSGMQQSGQSRVINGESNLFPIQEDQHRQRHSRQNSLNTMQIRQSEQDMFQQIQQQQIQQQQQIKSSATQFQSSEMMKLKKQQQIATSKGLNQVIQSDSFDMTSPTNISSKDFGKQSQQQQYSHLDNYSDNSNWEKQMILIPEQNLKSNSTSRHQQQQSQQQQYQQQQQAQFNLDKYQIPSYTSQNYQKGNQVPQLQNNCYSINPSPSISQGLLSNNVAVPQKHQQASQPNHQSCLISNSIIQGCESASQYQYIPLLQDRSQPVSQEQNKQQLSQISNQSSGYNPAVYAPSQTKKKSLSISSNLTQPLQINNDNGNLLQGNHSISSSNNTCMSNQNSQNCSQILGQCSNSSRSPNRNNSSRKVSYCGGQVNGGFQSNLPCYASTSQSHNNSISSNNNCAINMNNNFNSGNNYNISYSNPSHSNSQTSFHNLGQNYPLTNGNLTKETFQQQVNSSKGISQQSSFCSSNQQQNYNYSHPHNNQTNDNQMGSISSQIVKGISNNSQSSSFGNLSQQQGQQTNLTFADQLKIEKTKKTCKDKVSSVIPQLSQQQIPSSSKSQQYQSNCSSNTNSISLTQQQFTPFSAADTTSGLTRDYLSNVKSDLSTKQISASNTLGHSRKDSSSTYFCPFSSEKQQQQIPQFILPQMDNCGIYEQQQPNHQILQQISMLPPCSADSKYFTLQYSKSKSKQGLDSHQNSFNEQQKESVQANLAQIKSSSSSNSLTKKQQPSAQQKQNFLPKNNDMEYNSRYGRKASYLNQDDDCNSKAHISSECRNSRNLQIYSDIRNIPFDSESSQYPQANSNYSQNSIVLEPNNLTCYQQAKISDNANNSLKNTAAKWYLHDSQGGQDIAQNNYLNQEFYNQNQQSSKQLRGSDNNFQASAQIYSRSKESTQSIKQNQLIESIQIGNINSESSSLTQISTQRDDFLPKPEQVPKESTSVQAILRNDHSISQKQRENEQQLARNYQLEELENLALYFSTKDEVKSSIQMRESVHSLQNNNFLNFPSGNLYSSIESLPLQENAYVPRNNEASNHMNSKKQLYKIQENPFYQVEGFNSEKEREVQLVEYEQDSTDEAEFLKLAELVCEEQDIAEERDKSEGIGLQIISNVTDFYNLEPHQNKLSKQSDFKVPMYDVAKNFKIESLSYESEEEKTKRVLREIEEFEADLGQFPIFGSENLEYLVMRDAQYAPDPFYLTPSKQENLTTRMRSILFDWMMEVSEEFGLKRETYHIAINLVDRYLSFQLHIKKRDFQLIGVTSLYMASKLEEIYPPRIGDFVCSTNNGYKSEEINEQELKILQTLKFMINPPTLNMWSNWFMSQWDIFLMTSECAQQNQLVLQFSAEFDRLVQFKQPDEPSYLLFREFMQAVDCEPRQMLASLMYIVLGKGFCLFDTSIILQDFAEGRLSFQADEEFNSLFNEFTKLSFGFLLESILSTIQYVAPYFAVPLNKELPSAAKNDKEKIFKGYYEDFLAFQTHNKEQLSIIQKKL